MINIDPHYKKEKGLVPILTPRGELMWVHPDIIQSQQWTNITNRKSKGKAKASSCNVVYASSREAETDVAALTDSEEKENCSRCRAKCPFYAGIRSGQQYLKEYNEAVTNSSKPTK